MNSLSQTEHQLVRSTSNPFVTNKMYVMYYCYRRKGHFKRLINVDLDLEIQRKINGLHFHLIRPTVGIGRHDTLVIDKIDGKSLGVGDICSLPAYLFGPEYWFARRKDPTNNWDFRKEAFIPVPGAAERYKQKFQIKH